MRDEAGFSNVTTAEWHPRKPGKLLLAYFEASLLSNDLKITMVDIIVRRFEISYDLK